MPKTTSPRRANARKLARTKKGGYIARWAQIGLAQDEKKQEIKLLDLPTEILTELIHQGEFTKSRLRAIRSAHPVLANVAAPVLLETVQVPLSAKLFFNRDFEWHVRCLVVSQWLEDLRKYVRMIRFTDTVPADCNWMLTEEHTAIITSGMLSKLFKAMPRLKRIDVESEQGHTHFNYEDLRLVDKIFTGGRSLHLKARLSQLLYFEHSAIPASVTTLEIAVFKEKSRHRVPWHYSGLVELSDPTDMVMKMENLRSLKIDMSPGVDFENMVERLGVKDANTLGRIETLALRAFYRLPMTAGFLPAFTNLKELIIEDNLRKIRPEDAENFWRSVQQSGRQFSTIRFPACSALFDYLISPANQNLTRLELDFVEIVEDFTFNQLAATFWEVVIPKLRKQLVVLHVRRIPSRHRDRDEMHLLETLVAVVSWSPIGSTSYPALYLPLVESLAIPLAYTSVGKYNAIKNNLHCPRLRSFQLGALSAAGWHTTTGRYPYRKMYWERDQRLQAYQRFDEIVDPQTSMLNGEPLLMEIKSWYLSKGNEASNKRGGHFNIDAEMQVDWAAGVSGQIAKYRLLYLPHGLVPLGINGGTR